MASSHVSIRHPGNGRTSRAFVALVLFPALTYLVAFAALTWPLLTSFSTSFFSDGGDGMQNAWNLWWVDKALTELHCSPWYTDYLYHPDGVSLLGHTLNPINGLIGIPLSRVLDQIATYNTIVVLSFVTTGVTMFWLCFYLGRRYWIALFCGGLLPTSSYWFAHAEGHMNLITLQWVPLFLLLWVRLLDRPRIVTAVGASLALLLVLLTDYYYTLFTVIAGAGLFLGATVTRRRALALFSGPHLLPMCVFVVLSTAFALPLVLALLNRQTADPWGGHEPLMNSMDLLAPFIPGSYWRFRDLTEPFWSSVSASPVGSSHYVRWTVLVPAMVAAIGFRTRRIPHGVAWIGLWAFFFFCALGPVMQIWGHRLDGLPMPYAALNALPLLELSGAPMRMGMMVTLVGIVFANHGLPVLLRKIGPRWAVLFFAVFVIETLPPPQTTLQPVMPDHVEALRDFPEGAVLGLAGHSDDLLFQTRFEKPMTLGYVSRVPRSLSNRRAEIRKAVVDGDVRQLMDRLETRYAVLDRYGDPPQYDGLKLVFVGDRKIILTRREDVLPEVSIPARDCMSGATVRTEVERDASRRPVALLVDSPEDHGRHVLAAFSLSSDPPTRLPDGRSIPIARDRLFDLHGATSGRGIGAHVGLLDDSGHARIALDMSKFSELRGRQIHFAVLVHDRHAPSEICRISPAGDFRVP